MNLTIPFYKHYRAISTLLTLNKKLIIIIIAIIMIIIIVLIIIVIIIVIIIIIELETRKYWIDVQRGIVSSHRERDPLEMVSR